MIAADTSSLVSFLRGDFGDDCVAIKDALINHILVFPPVVLAEVLSDPKLEKFIVSTLCQIPLLAITQGYWQRAGANRAKLTKRKFKAKIADVLIMQSCLDHNVPLITRDTDFKTYQKIFPLKVL